MSAPDLPRRQILADCYAALRPSPSLWAKWLAEIDRLSQSGGYSETDVDVMRFSPEAQRALMDRTFGDPDAIGRTTADEALAAAKSAITAPIAGELREVNEELTRERKVREEAEDDAKMQSEATAAVKVAFKRDRAERHDALRRSADRCAWIVAWVLYVILLVVLAASVLMSLFGIVSPETLPVAVRLGTRVTAVFVAFAAWAGSGWGWHVRVLVDRLQAMLAPIFFARSLRRIGETEALTDVL